MICYKTVDIEVEIDDFSTTDIIDELKRRRDISIKDVCGLLEALNIPREMIQPIQGYILTKPVGIKELEKWQAWAKGEAVYANTY